VAATRAQSFETLKVGLARIAETTWDIRLVREHAEPRAYFAILAMTAAGPFPSAEEALAHCAQTYPDVCWRTGLEPGADDAPCPVCRAAVERWPRYPRMLCPPCVLEAVDREGQGLRFDNTSMSGGFEARRADGVVSADHACWVRGIACWADEAKFGGIVVQPFADRTR
jgi:hypothetical protein